MRSDIALYTVAVISFILTGIVVAYTVEPNELWIIATTIIGLTFAGIGYTQRPRPQLQPTPTQIEVPTASASPTVAEVAPPVEEKPQQTVEAPPPSIELTKVKGIGEKRATQLKALGITSVEHLAKASQKDLASELKISPKITGKWIDQAKELAKET